MGRDGPAHRDARVDRDFGGGSGIRRVLREYDVVDPDEVSRIRYREYDWSLALDAFRDRSDEGSD